MAGIDIGGLISIAEEASKLILKAEDPVIQRKRSNSDYTTGTDLEVEQYLTESLQKSVPGCSVVAEESADLFNIPEKKDIFIVDPIDGTINFFHNYKASAVSIAYLEWGELKMGVVVDPYRKETFHACRGEGAFLNNVPIQVSSTERLENALAGFGTAPYDKEEGKRMLDAASRVYSSCQDLRRLGAAALDLVHVACGRLDLFFERSLNPWDYFAGMIIIQEAGGTCTDWNNSRIKKISTSHVCGSNGILHDDIISILKDSQS
jgi:myo-inositol-1(or 4)-monophosphatase